MTARWIPRALLPALGVTVACHGTAPPDVAPPEVGAFEHYAAEHEAGALPDAPWWEAFGDDELVLVVEEALAHNRDLAAAAARVEQAAALARIAGADLDPSLSLGLDASRRRQVFVGFPFGGGTTFDSRSALFSAAWEVDLWGRVAAGVAAAGADLVASAADHEAARRSVAAQAAKALLAVREARQQVALASDSVATFQRTLDIVRARFEGGRESSIQVLLAESDLAGARAELLRREEEEARAVRRLEVLVDRYPGGALGGADTLPALPPPPPPGLPVELLERRPDLVAAGARVAAAAARVEEADKARWPSLTLTGTGGTTSDRLGDLLDGDFRVWSLGAGLTAPLLQGGRLRAGLDLADARAREAAEQWASALLVALLEVETALAVEASLEAREAQLATSAEQARRARAEATERYSAGRADFLTVLTTQRRELAADALLLSHRRRRLEARVDLYLALGGGFPVAPPAEPDA